MIFNAIETLSFRAEAAETAGGMILGIRHFNMVIAVGRCKGKATFHKANIA
jgi:hypothetical protein